ncbi:MAG TPA: TetR/AcrR family transcriptional regulator [Acidimicrobiales bacterium]|nr:TetR/AcrR family transcriptional regulator [Acidimicrobiales bacterium]
MTAELEKHSLDGRRARGERTRLKVIEALLDLVDDGTVRPTAQEVAARAGVALRTVYHHFEDVEALRRLALDLQMRRHAEILQPVDARLALDERIQTIAGQCRRLFEILTPIRRATMFDEQSSPEMAQGIAFCTRTRRDHVIATFAPELRRAGAEERVLTDSIDFVTAWPTWEYLRAAVGRSPAAATRAIVASLQALLRPLSRHPGP